MRGRRLTDGDVDPTLGSALELAGYDRDWTLIEADNERDTASTESARPGHDAADRDDGPFCAACARARRAPWSECASIRRCTVELPPGVKLDLGATAKAWAADRAAQLARTGHRLRGVLVSLGGDISTSGHRPAGGWRVHVTDDHRDGPDTPGQTDRDRERRPRHLQHDRPSVATRRTPMHHIIDPLTGTPAQTRWRTVSVAAESCADANIAATAAIVRGERALQWLAALDYRLDWWPTTARCPRSDRGRGSLAKSAAFSAMLSPPRAPTAHRGRRPRTRERRMSGVLAAAGPSAYWYLTRSTGAVSLVLLTLALVLGVVDVGRWSSVAWPRFVVDSLHRNASLLALAFLAFTSSPRCSTASRRSRSSMR